MQAAAVQAAARSSTDTLPHVSVASPRRPSFRVPNPEDVSPKDDPPSPDKNSPALSVEEMPRMRRRGSQL